jgi:hypothetical protein
VTTILDTGPLDVTETTSAQAVTTPREVWRKARLPVLLGLLFVVIALVKAITTGGISSARLDPDAAGPQGARALATLLRDHGVDLRVVDRPTGAAGTTVFVPVPELARALSPGSLEAGAGAAELVVAGPDDAALESLSVDARVGGRTGEDVIDPGCAQPDAVAAGDVLLGGRTFGAPETAVPCYATGGRATFVELRSARGRVTLLGTASFMTNEHLAKNGNAALALRLLTRHPVVEWVYPRTFDGPAGEGDRTVGSLLPHRFFVLVAQLLVVVLLLALWRGRRLGPVVVEPLPVVVRAAEAVEGRARLYEAAGSRDQAANALRAGLRDRLVRLLGLTPDAGRETMVAAVTSRTGRDAANVDDLLYGPPPADDEALVRLATELDRLDTEVRAQ